MSTASSAFPPANPSSVAAGADRPGPSPSPGERAAWTVVAVVLLAIGVAYARARWPGFLPLGSDNDEYQLAGQALAAFELPLIAGVEGTKYPLGYPAILTVLEWLRLPVAPTALALNVVAVAATTGIVAHLAGRATATRAASPGAALAAGAVVVTSVSVWNDAYSVMPELATLLVVAGLLAALAGPLTRRRLAVIVGLAVVAVLLKTLTALLIVGGCGVLWAASWLRPSLAGGPDRDAAVGGGAPGRWRALLPAGAAVATVLAGMALVRSLPEHTTGYLATFPLKDPFDASRGTLGVGGLVRRTIADVPATLTDLGRAIALIDAGTAVAVTVALVGLTLGVVAAHRLAPGTPLGPFAAGATIAYAVGMAGWPYHSSRFGIPLVPIAALGVGWVVRSATHRWAALVLGGAVTGAFVATSWAAVVDRGEAGRARLEVQHAAMDRLESFADDELTDERLVSFDYREVAHLLDRDVAPLTYTTDTDALLEQVGDAEVVVMVDINHRRNAQLEAMLESEPDRFEPLLEGDAVGAWRIRSPS